MITLHEEIQKAMQVMGYTSLFSVQEKVIPLLLEGENVVVRSKTGSGKTAAYGIPMCEKIVWEENRVQACVLVPTRELAMQVSEEIKQLGRFRKIKVVTLYGKEKETYQIQALTQKSHILIATPGRLWDLLVRGYVDFSKLGMFVLDEADYMLDLGFQEQVDDILTYVPNEIQFALFSATYPEAIMEKIRSRNIAYQMVECEEEANIAQYYAMETDFPSLCKLLMQCEKDSCMIFCERQTEVEELKKQFLKKGITVCASHGAMPQKKRFSSLASFRKGERKILVTTDVAARGIDIEKVAYVIHYRLPHTKEEYLHRIGRSGRKEETGISIAMVDGEESSLRFIASFALQAWEKEAVVPLSHWQGSALKEETNIWGEHVCKVYVSAGKEKKIRAGDIIGAFCSVEGVEKEDIGVIEVLHKMSYVELFHGKETLIVEAFKEKTIKNKKVKVEIAKEKIV